MYLAMAVDQVIYSQPSIRQGRLGNQRFIFFFSFQNHSSLVQQCFQLKLILRYSISSLRGCAIPLAFQYPRSIKLQLQIIIKSMSRLRYSRTSMNKSNLSDFINDSMREGKLEQIAQKYWNLDKQLKQLKQRQKDFISDLKLTQAQLIKNRIYKVTEDIYYLQGQALNKKKDQENQELQFQIEAQIMDFNEKWDKILAQKHLEHQNNLLKLQKQQQIESIQKKQKLQKQPKPRVKYSRQILNRKTHLDSLITTRQYQLAQVTKVQIQKLELKEIDQWNKNHQQKIMLKLSELHKRHFNQREALKKKLYIEFAQKQKLKQSQLQKLLKKCMNKRRDVQNRYQILMSRHVSMQKTINLNKTIGKQKRSITSSRIN